MTLLGSATLAATLVICGCAADPGVADGLARVGQIGPEHESGRIRLVGNRPFGRTVLERDDGEAVEITGDLAEEIGRLAGVDVMVTGSFEEGSRSEGRLVATSYEVVSVEGEQAIVGTLERDEDGFLLATQAREVRVVGVPENLADRLGTLMWVVLDENSGIARYGVLRSPTP